LRQAGLDGVQKDLPDRCPEPRALDVLRDLEPVAGVEHFGRLALAAAQVRFENQPFVGMKRQALRAGFASSRFSFPRRERC
jgi:hypothetical protein